MKRKILLVSWSHVDLAFKKFIEHEIGEGFVFFRFSHHHDWNTFNRSIIKNFFHIGKQLLEIIKISRNSEIILFGTNLCRMLFPVLGAKKAFYIYNELPSFSSKLLMFYDQFIFSSADKIYLSSDARRDLIEKIGFNTKRVRVIENITFSSFEQLLFKDGEHKDIKKAILIGTLDETRFGGDVIKLLNSLISEGFSVDVLPSSIKRGLNIHYNGINFLDPIPHEEVISLLKKYDYGILAYEPSSLNNDYAAPLKLYEYINAGLKVICLLPNKGMDAIKINYPTLIFDLNKTENFSFDQYLLERSLFLESALSGNKQFANSVVSKYKCNK